MPSLTRSERPLPSLRRKSASVMRSTAPVRDDAQLLVDGDAWAGHDPERYPGVAAGPRLKLGSPGT